MGRAMKNQCSARKRWICACPIDNLATEVCHIMTENSQPPITITIDGVQYTVDNRRQTAAELLWLAGIDATTHDLARVLGQVHVEKQFDEYEEIKLTPGAFFGTILNGRRPVG